MRHLLLAASLLCSVANAQTTQPIACNETVRGTLAAGGGANTYTFPGATNQTVTAILYPISPSFTNPVLTLGPQGLWRAPVMSGGKGAQITSVLPVGGSWSVSVGSRDAGASGDYVVQLACRGTNISPTNQQACLKQWILCGQTIEWSLSPGESCRFFNDLSTAYEFFAFYGSAGDTLTLEVESDDFAPRLNIYPGNKGGSPIARSTIVSPTKSTLSYEFNVSGQIDIAVTSREGNRFGRFKLTTNACTSAGCLQPVIVDSPDVTVPYGTSATLGVTAFSLAPLRYLWWDRSDLPPVLLREGPVFTTPATIARRYYSVSAIAPCGTTDSRVIAVTPAPPLHRRAARH